MQGSVLCKPTRATLFAVVPFFCRNKMFRNPVSFLCRTLLTIPEPSANKFNLTAIRAVSNQSNSSKYRYTLDQHNIKLSQEQRDFYEENGFIVIKNLISQQEIAKYWQRFDDLASGKVKPSGDLVLQKELASAKKKGDLSERDLYKVQYLYADEVLFEYCKNSDVLDYAQSFTGPNVMAIHTMLINKPPDSGSKSSRHPLHQDIHYFPIRPADRIVCAWTAMERVTRENGCLVAIPGSHKGEHLEHVYPDWEGGVNKFYYGIKDMSTQDARVHLEMDAGDCVFFHPILIHGSGINRTKGFRKAISSHFASANCEYTDVKGTMKENLANEIIEALLYQKKIENKVEYWQIWKSRSRQVRGEQGSL